MEPEKVSHDATDSRPDRQPRPDRPGKPVNKKRLFGLLGLVLLIAVAGLIIFIVGDDQSNQPPAADPDSDPTSGPAGFNLSLTGPDQYQTGSLTDKIRFLQADFASLNGFKDFIYRRFQDLQGSDCNQINRQFAPAEQTNLLAEVNRFNQTYNDLRLRLIALLDSLTSSPISPDEALDSVFGQTSLVPVQSEFELYHDQLLAVAGPLNQACPVSSLQSLIDFWQQPVNLAWTNPKTGRLIDVSDGSDDPLTGLSSQLTVTVSSFICGINSYAALDQSVEAGPGLFFCIIDLSLLNRSQSELVFITADQKLVWQDQEFSPADGDSILDSHSLDQFRLAPGQATPTSVSWIFEIPKIPDWEVNLHLKLTSQTGQSVQIDLEGVNHSFNLDQSDDN